MQSRPNRAKAASRPRLTRRTTPTARTRAAARTSPSATIPNRGQRSIGGGSFTSNGDSAGGLLADNCSPSAVWQKYPHGLSEAPDCTYKNSPCAQKYDVGSWSAQGLGGQFVVGHPGLDLVLIAKNFSGGNGPAGIWDAIRPALVALDETYKGDDAAFCKAYAAGEYAPDLPSPVVQPAD